MPQVYFLLVGGSTRRLGNGDVKSGGRQSKHLDYEILKVFQTILSGKEVLESSWLTVSHWQSQVIVHLSFTNSLVSSILKGD